MQSWQQQLKAAVTDLDELLSLLQLKAEQFELDPRAVQAFALRVPRHFVEKMAVGDAADPLFLQVLPQAAELIEQPGYSREPLAEQQFNPLPGLLHKYQSRVLLTITSGCAVNCRYCFRKNFAYQDNGIGEKQWQAILNYIEQHPEINEVIFSGGDPLLVQDQKWQFYLDQLQQLKQLKRLRIHTRLPIVLPARLTGDFMSMLSRCHLPVILVTHANHPNEICDEVGLVLRTLAQQNVTVLNQSVLLKGINDDAEILADLSERLFQFSVMPYYLHALDKVSGTQHFLVDDNQSQQIYQQLQKKMPGFLLPKFVREQVGAQSKSIIYV